MYRINLGIDVILVNLSDLIHNINMIKMPGIDMWGEYLYY